MSILTMNIEESLITLKVLCQYLERKTQHTHKRNVQQGVTLFTDSFHVLYVICLRLTCVKWFESAGMRLRSTVTL